MKLLSFRRSCCSIARLSQILRHVELQGFHFDHRPEAHRTNPEHLNSFHENAIRRRNGNIQSIISALAKHSPQLQYLHLCGLHLHGHYDLDLRELSALQYLSYDVERICDVEHIYELKDKYEDGMPHVLPRNIKVLTVDTPYREWLREVLTTLPMLPKLEEFGCSSTKLGWYEKGDDQVTDQELIELAESMELTLIRSIDCSYSFVEEALIVTRQAWDD